MHRCAPSGMTPRHSIHHGLRSAEQSVINHPTGPNASPQAAPRRCLPRACPARKPTAPPTNPQQSSQTNIGLRSGCSPPPKDRTSWFSCHCLSRSTRTRRYRQNTTTKATVPGGVREKGCATTGFNDARSATGGSGGTRLRAGISMVCVQPGQSINWVANSSGAARCCPQLGHSNRMSGIPDAFSSGLTSDSTDLDNIPFGGVIQTPSLRGGQAGLHRRHWCAAGRRRSSPR